MYSRILALADFYDALTTRINDHHGELRRISGDEGKQILIAANQDQKHLIEELYKENIFM